MSGEATNIFSRGNVLPKYVVEETLKRARVETEAGDAIQTTISGIDNDHPLPVMMKSASTQWFVRGRYAGSFRYYPLQWFCASPQPLLSNTHAYGYNKWVYVSPKSVKQTPGVAEPDLTKPRAYLFGTGASSTFAGGWVAGYSESNGLSSITLLAFKAGNTDITQPDVEVGTGGLFEWDGDDFTACTKFFDSPTLYLNNVGGQATDEAWSGSGSGTVISLLKGIANIF